MLVVLFHFRIL